MAAFSFRLPEGDREALEAMALLTGQSAASVARVAVARMLDEFTESGEASRLAGEHNQAAAAAVRLLQGWRDR